MKKWMFTLGIMSMLVVGGCGGEVTPSSTSNEVAASESTEDDNEGSTEVDAAGTNESSEPSDDETAEVVEEAVTVLEETEEEEINAEVVVSESGTLTQPVNEEGEEFSKTLARDYYLTVTKPVMDDLNSQVSTIWKTHLIDAMPDKVFSDEWNSTFMFELGILADSYYELIDQLQEIPVADLGEYSKHVDDFSYSMLDSISVRMDASLAIIESVEETGNALANMDEYNAFVDDAMVYQEEAVEHQRLLEEALEIVE